MPYFLVGSVTYWTAHGFLGCFVMYSMRSIPEKSFSPAVLSTAWQEEAIHTNLTDDYSDSTCALGQTNPRERGTLLPPPRLSSAPKKSLARSLKGVSQLLWELPDFHLFLLSSLDYSAAMCGQQRHQSGHSFLLFHEKTLPLLLPPKDQDTDYITKNANAKSYGTISLTPASSTIWSRLLFQGYWHLQPLQ